ncbi:MAG: hypothetical protein V2I63_08480 [Pseudomonadales bacterium]|jgi:hypothetical protein|nr:hypothetical protein [Pseudomonadales bacterium]
MSRLALPSRRTLAASIVLLTLLPVSVNAEGPQSPPALDEPTNTVVAPQAPVSAVEASGLLVWAWRALTPDRPVAERLSLSRFAPEPATDVASLAASTRYEFGVDTGADRWRLHHGGNLLRIDF